MSFPTVVGKDQVGEDLVGTLFCVQSKWFKVKRIDSYHALYFLPYCRDYSASVGFSLAATSCAVSVAAAGKFSIWLNLLLRAAISQICLESKI